MKHFPRSIAVTKGKIKNIQEDIVIRDNGTQPNADGFSPMVVQGATFKSKKGAGTAILAACKSMFSGDPIQLGQYRGFTMELYFDAWWKEHKLTLIGSRSNTVSLGSDLFGNIQRIDNMLDGLEVELKGEETNLSNYEAQLASAKVEVEKPFPQEDELKTNSARLDQLNIELNLDKQENEIVDGEPDENSPPPARDNSDRER